MKKIGIFVGKRFECKHCGCSWKFHMYKTTTFEKIARKILTPIKLKTHFTMEEAEKIIKESIETLEIYLEEFRQEINAIQKISAKFACILNKSTHLHYNRYLEPYIDMLIQEEKTKFNIYPNFPNDFYLSLCKLKDDHQRKVKFLIEKIEKGKKANVKLADASKYINKLKRLKHSMRTFVPLFQLMEDKEKCDELEVDKKTINLTKCSKPSSLVEMLNSEMSKL